MRFVLSRPGPDAVTLAVRAAPVRKRSARRRVTASLRARLGSHTVALVACVLLVVLLSTPAFADNARDLIRQGNEHYAAGRYADALRSYDQALAGGQSAELLHDRAAVLFKLGRLDEAREQWSRVRDLKDAAFEARAHYNLGNCDYAEALTAAQKDGQKALAALGHAADRYREALRLDPSLNDARANLELTQLLKKQIEEQKQEQQKQGPSSQAQKDQQKQPSSQPSSQPSQQQDQEKSEQSQQSEQNNPSPDSQPTTQPAQSQPQRPESQPQQQEHPEENENQKPPEQSGEEQPPESQPAKQPEAKSAQSQPSKGEEGKEQPSALIHLTREQAERLLQMVRDAEKARRELLARQRIARQKPVDKDW